MPGSHVRVLLNPRAGAGIALRKLPEVRSALRKYGLEHDVVETRSQGDAARLAREAQRDGVKVLAVMGGDGTLNEVAQAYVDGEGAAIEGPELAVVPAGTGGDYKRTLGLRDDVDEAVSRIRRGNTRAHDLGFLRLVDDDRKSVTKSFINITSFGIGGVTDKLVNDSPKWLGGKASFLLGGLRAALTYRNAPVRVRVDGVLFHEGPVFNVAISIGRFHGGGMHIAPDADPGDGKFDVVAIGDVGKVQMARLQGRIYAGEHLGEEDVYVARGTTVEAEAVHPWGQVLIDMDGETPGTLPMSAKVVPGAIRVIV